MLFLSSAVNVHDLYVSLLLTKLITSLCLIKLEEEQSTVLPNFRLL